MVTSGVYIIHRRITSFNVVQEPTCTHVHEYRLLGASCYSCAVAAWVKVSPPFFFLLLLLLLFLFLCFGVTFVHANLCTYILASTFQDGGNPFPVTRLLVLNSVTDSSWYTLLLPALHSQWSRQVYIIQQCITGFLVVQEPTRTHAHEYRLLGASCHFYFLVSHLCMQIYACIF